MYVFKELGFRPLEKEDLEAVRELRNDPTTWAALTSIGQISRAGQERWFEMLQHDTGRAYFSVFEVKRDHPVMYYGDMVGVIRMDEIDINNRSVRVGCDVMPTMRGKGWGTMIMESILDFTFRQWNMHRAWLCVKSDNNIAHRLYTSAGFKEEGRMRAAIYRDGEYTDYIVMSILRDEYNARIIKQRKETRG